MGTLTVKTKRDVEELIDSLIASSGLVESVTGLNTNNTDPTNPVVGISIGSGLTGSGTPASPLATTGLTPTARAINTTAPLSGGGDLSADRTLTTSMATGKLIGRSSAGTGVMEEIAVGSGLSLAAGTLSASGGSGASIGVALAFASMASAFNQVG